MKLIAVTRALAGAVKSVIDTPILSKEGNISYEAEDIYDQTIEKLPDFSQAVQEVKSINYDAKPVAAKSTSTYHGSKNTTSVGTTIMSSARRVFAVITGFILASAFAEKIAISVTGDINKFLFLDSFTANKIAVWLLLCASVTMLIGKFKHTKVEKLCCFGSGVSLFILYVQYCRSVEQMNHYIIFSMIFCGVFIVVSGFLEVIKYKWDCGLFFFCVSIIMMLWPIGFLIYAFFGKFLGFSENFCLLVTSGFFFVISVSVIFGILDE